MGITPSSYIHPGLQGHRVILSRRWDRGLSSLWRRSLFRPRAAMSLYKRARMEKILFGVPKSSAQADLNQHMFYSNLKLRDESVMVSSHPRMLGKRLVGGQGTDRQLTTLLGTITSVTALLQPTTPPASLSTSPSSLPSTLRHVDSHCPRYPRRRSTLTPLPRSTVVFQSTDPPAS